MRYTTIIDITEIRAVWANPNTTRLYVYLCLKCGYRDDDRDIIDISLHRLEADTGLTFSAVRNALKQLQKVGLVTREADAWRVKKWCMQSGTSPRPKRNQAAAASQAGDIVRQAEEQMEERRRMILKVVSEVSREELTEWISELEDRRSIVHHRVTVPCRRDWIEWMKNMLEKK